MDGNVLDFSMFRKVPMIQQAEIAECGLACLAMIAGFHGNHVSLIELRQKYSANLKGMNLQQLLSIADNYSLKSRALKCPLDQVQELRLPCLLHWDMNHFVVLTKVTGRNKNFKFQINDPGVGRIELGLNEFSKHFTGICVEFNKANGFNKTSKQPSLKLRQLWSNIIGLKSALIWLFVISLFLQCFFLMTPYYMQWVIDEVLVSFDSSLLTVLAIGFVFLLVFTVLSMMLRGWLIIRLSSELNYQLGSNVINHLFKLPVQFFESRHIGDIVSRFGSLQQIRERLTTGVIEAAMDGLLTVIIVAVMLWYSWLLTSVVFVAILGYILIRSFCYQRYFHLSRQQIEHSAQEQSHFIESVKAIQTIKLFSKESHREGIWQNSYAKVLNDEIRLGRLDLSFQAWQKTLFGLENIVVVYLAAQLVMVNQFTVGMLIAFMAFKGQLTERVNNLIEQIILFKMLRLHLERLADIVLNEAEPRKPNLISSIPKKAASCMSLSKVSFAYPDGTKVCDNINLQINAGDSIAIIGSSGQGKTTLLKLMLGLTKPTAGSIKFNGTDIEEIGVNNYRQYIATVMQVDTLLSGSLIDNISFFDPSPDLGRIEKCAKQAEIHHDICQMSMGYQSMVGDLGVGLSGGQVQRILLARALYTKPEILFLDEASSHLDSVTELNINNTLRALQVTRVIVAHRQETIAMADRVFELKDGSLKEVRTSKATHSLPVFNN